MTAVSGIYEHSRIGILFQAFCEWNKRLRPLTTLRGTIPASQRSDLALTLPTPGAPPFTSE